MEALLIPQSKRGIMGEEDRLHDDDVDNFGSFSSFSSEESDSCNSTASTFSSEESVEDDAASSSSSSSSSSQFSQLSTSPTICPLYQMSDLMAELPIKRGLSKHYQGKSQSFTSLSHVMSLDDLPKQEGQTKKRLKTCKSYGGGLSGHYKPYSPSMNCSSRTISKKPSKGSLSSSLGKRHVFLGARRPVPPQRSGSFSGQTLLFAA